MSEANAILMQFVEADVAWVWCLKLLRSVDQFVQYFAANMLLTKARKHWGQLTTQQHDEVCHDLVMFLHEYVASATAAAAAAAPSSSSSCTAERGEAGLGFAKTFVNRIALVLAVICCQNECQSPVHSPAGDVATASGLDLFMKLGTGNLTDGQTHIIHCSLDECSNYTQHACICPTTYTH